MSLAIHFWSGCGPQVDAVLEVLDHQRAGCINCACLDLWWAEVGNHPSPPEYPQDLAKGYEISSDPRLNGTQSLGMAFFVAEIMRG